MWFVQSHCRDLRPGYDHLLRNVKAAQVIIASKSTPFRRCYGPELTFAAEAMQNWLVRGGIKPIRIYPGSPWENGYNERFNARIRDELLNG